MDGLETFKMLVSILKSRLLEVFGDVIVISCSDAFFKDLKTIAEFFESFSIRLNYELKTSKTDDLSQNEEKELKHYRLWVHMPCKQWLCLSFDHIICIPSPTHLE